MTYEEFIENKKIISSSNGFSVPNKSLNPKAFEWQKDIIRWALQKGRCELWEECGLGKTLQSLEWARHICEREKTNVIIFAPLAVSKQTKEEGEKFGIPVNIIENQSDIKTGINITNYEKLEKFDYSSFGGVVLDESSILKSHSGITRNMLNDIFRNTPYKLGCSATPAPNDYMEIGCHAEFLGIMSRAEMLSTYFVHDSGDTAKWRLKGHAAEKFWEWIASWAVVMQKPSDLGYPDDGYLLPSLNLHEHIVHAENYESTDRQMSFFPIVAQTLMERRVARKNSTNERVDKAAEIANSTDEQVLIWCDLNIESEMLSKAVNDSVEVKGADSDNHKTTAMNDFTHNRIRVLISKPSIAGWGMNWQNCHKVIFVGLSDSFEQYYQAVRRCWRYGQEKPVDVHIVVADSEGAVRQNIQKKHEEFQRMTTELVKHTQNILAASIQQTQRITETYEANEKIKIPKWIVGETCERESAVNY